jgi:hypothetical protein
MPGGTHQKRLRLAGTTLFLLALFLALSELFVFGDTRSAMTAGGSGILLCVLISKASRSSP